jgi:hypothetical protein
MDTQKHESDLRWLNSEMEKITVAIDMASNYIMIN